MPNKLFAELKKDHKEVKSLINKLEKTSDESRQREELFTQLKQELQPHQKAEEHVFYPVLQKEEEVRKDVLEGIEEHHVAEVVLKEMDKMNKSEEQWSAKLSVLKELVDHHIEEEESKIFHDAERVLDQKQFDQISVKFQAEKQKVKSRMA